MSDLAGLIANASDHTATDVHLSKDTVAVLLYALGKVYETDVWQDFRGENIPQSDIEIIHDLVDKASYEVMKPIMATPVGALQLWLMETAPTGWLLCGGASHLKAQWPELHALWAGKYGATSTTFATPNLSGYSPMGVGSTVALDATAGSETVALAPSEMPVHNHTLTDPGHAHLLPRSSGTAGGTVQRPATPTTTALAPNTAITDSASTGITIGNAGGGNAHNNLHPVRGMHYIVYAGNEVI